MANTIDGYGSQFFPDQQVHAPDLNNIQYTSTQNFRTYLKNITKTFGVYFNTSTDTGLKVICNNAGTLLSVAPGIAVDTEGRIIHIPANPTVVSGSLGADPLYYPARPEISLFASGVSSAGTYYVNVYYIPIYGSPEPDDSGNTFYTRVYDSYRFAVESSIATSPGITLARGEFDSSGDLDTTADLDGYLAGSGVRYALFDERTGYETYDAQKGSADTSIQLLNEAIFEEELEKSAAFIFPAAGHSIVTKIHRNATIVRMELYMEVQSGETGSVEFSFYSGSTANAWRTGPLTLSTSTPDVFTIGSTLNMFYAANNPMKLELSRADNSVTRATVTIVYKRR